jgi:hypothetical protein
LEQAFGESLTAHCVLDRGLLRDEVETFGASAAQVPTALRGLFRKLLAALPRALEALTLGAFPVIQ